MANLSVYVSSYVNGVAKIHSEILKNSLFRDWYAAYPQRFQNKTNGITPRRWLGLCDPELTELITSRIGPGFLTNLDRLEELKPLIDDELIREFNRIKREKKVQLAAVIEKNEGVVINPDAVFDVQVKRLHEYKRQLLNALVTMDLYFSLKEGSLKDMPPLVCIFGAKSAPGYARAKAIIRYINRIAKLINGDPDMQGKLQVVFVQNYNCSYAEHIIPAADISEQISPAGTEASGTGNMKLMLNGAVTLGTMDGANVEIVERAGLENNYIFGATVEKINAIRDTYWARSIYDANPRHPPGGGHPGQRHRADRPGADGALHCAAGRRQLAPPRPLLPAAGLRGLPQCPPARHLRRRRSDALWPQGPAEPSRRWTLLLRPHHRPVRPGDLAYRKIK